MKQFFETTDKCGKKYENIFVIDHDFYFPGIDESETETTTHSAEKESHNN